MDGEDRKILNYYKEKKAKAQYLVLKKSSFHKFCLIPQNKITLLCSDT